MKFVQIVSGFLLFSSQALACIPEMTLKISVDSSEKFSYEVVRTLSDPDNPEIQKKYLYERDPDGAIRLSLLALSLKTADAKAVAAQKASVQAALKSFVKHWDEKAIRFYGQSSVNGMKSTASSLLTELEGRDLTSADLQKISNEILRPLSTVSQVGRDFKVEDHGTGFITKTRVRELSKAFPEGVFQSAVSEVSAGEAPRGVNFDAAPAAGCAVAAEIVPPTSRPDKPTKPVRPRPERPYALPKSNANEEGPRKNPGERPRPDRPLPDLNSGKR